MEKILKLGNLNKWFKTFIIFICYVCFFSVLYSLSFLYTYLINILWGEKISYTFFIVFIGIIIPICSFVIPILANMYLNLKNNFIYFVHTIIVILIILSAIIIDLNISNFPFTF